MHVESCHSQPSLGIPSAPAHGAGRESRRAGSKVIDTVTPLPPFSRESAGSVLLEELHTYDVCTRGQKGQARGSAPCIHVSHHDQPANPRFSAHCYPRKATSGSCCMDLGCADASPLDPLVARPHISALTTLTMEEAVLVGRPEGRRGWLAAWSVGPACRSGPFPYLVRRPQYGNP